MFNRHSIHGLARTLALLSAAPLVALAVGCAADASSEETWRVTQHLDPAALTFVYNGNGTVTYSSSGVRSCDMTYVRSDGSSGEGFPVPPNTSATAGAGEGNAYTL